mgnify:CR=1 FL=1
MRILFLQILSMLGAFCALPDLWRGVIVRQPLCDREFTMNSTATGTEALAYDAIVDDLRTAMKSSKGPGNFRNLFMYAPNGKKDGIQLLPVSEVAAKDEFWNIKNVTRDDQLAAHRVPPQLMGIIPSNTGGFGDVEKAAKVFARNEVKPLQDRLLAINEWVGEEVVRFAPYTLDGTEPVAA